MMKPTTTSALDAHREFKERLGRRASSRGPSHTSSLSAAAFFRFGFFFFFAAPAPPAESCAPSLPSFIMEETCSGLGLGLGLGLVVGLG